MPGTARHVFTSPIADGTDTQLVRPSDWNSGHLMTLNLVGSEVSGAFNNGGNVSFGLNTDGFITGSAPSAGGGLTNINVSAGTTSNNLSNFVLGNGNGITFGLDGSTVTASHNGLTTAAQSNQVVNSLNGSTGQVSLNVGSSLSASTNGSSITFGLASNITTALQSAGNYLTTAAQSNQVVNSLNGSTGQISLNVGSSLSASTNGSSITFGLASNITTALQSTGNYLTTARASNDAIGLNSAFTAGPLAMTINSSGLSLNAGSAAGTTSGFAGNLISGSMTHNTAGLNISLNHPAWLTTARASNDAVGLNSAFTAGPLAMTINSSGLSLNAGSAAGTTSGFAGNLISGSMTHNTAGLNLSLNHPAWLTTARASNDAIGLNTAQSNVTWTVNSSGLSLDARGYAGTGTTFNGTNVSGSMTLNSNGLRMDLSAPTPGGGGAINVSAGTTSGNLQTIEFSNGSGVSFGLNGSTITASVNAGGGGVAIAGGGATATSGTVVFSNSNNISFGLNGQTMTASYSAPTESMFWRPNDLITTVGAPINASASVVYCPMDHNLSASRFDLIASINVATAANNSSAGFLYSITAAVYTLNGATLSSLSSITTANQMSWTSNATGSVTGAFFLSAPLNVNAVADKYWVGVQLSTRATGLTGAATTSLGNTVSLMGVGTAIAGAFSAREPGSATNNSNGWFKGMGMYSGTSNFSTIGLSNITQQGTNMNRAGVALRMLNV